MLFLSDFSRKNHCSHAYILPKNLHSPKNTMFSYPYLIKKSSILWKTQCSHVIFSIFFSKNQQLLCPYLVKKRQFCQNYTILWAKKVNRMPFFSDFPRKNNNSHAHILSTKRPFYKKHTFLMPIFCQKTSILSKTPSSQVIFFNFFM